MKKCKKCNEVKEFSEFSVRKEGKDGYYNACKLCRNKYAHQESYKEKNKEYVAKNWDKIYETKKKHHAKFKAEYDVLYKEVYGPRHRAKNPELHRERCRDYKKRNPGICSDLTNKRRCEKIAASIPLTEDKTKEMAEIFKAAGELRKIHGKYSYAVDHIIPLQHPEVCGLNVPWNMQVLSITENSSKHNKFDGTYDNDSWRLSCVLPVAD